MLSRVKHQPEGMHANSSMFKLLLLALSPSAPPTSWISRLCFLREQGMFYLHLLLSYPSCFNKMWYHWKIAAWSQMWLNSSIHCQRVIYKWQEEEERPSRLQLLKPPHRLWPSFWVGQLTHGLRWAEDINTDYKGGMRERRSTGGNWLCKGGQRMECEKRKGLRW